MLGMLVYLGVYIGLLTQGFEWYTAAAFAFAAQFFTYAVMSRR